MTRKTALIVSLFAATSFPAAGQSAVDVPSLAEAAGNYAISSSSHIAFAVDQIGGGGIKGEFGKFSGMFNLKAGDLARSVVSFELRPESVSTGQGRIDAFLRSGAVFDSGHFDTISFRSERVEQTGPDSARITGTLTAKGHSSPESFDVKLTSWNGRMIGFSVSGKIFRSRYAMDVGTPIYSNVVQFDMNDRGTAELGRPASASMRFAPSKTGWTHGYLDWRAGYCFGRYPATAPLLAAEICAN